MDETIQVSNVTVTPVTSVAGGETTGNVVNATPVDQNQSNNATTNGIEGLTKDTEELAKKFEQVLDAVSKENPEDTEETKEGKRNIREFMRHISSREFKENMDKKAEKMHVSKKYTVKAFFTKVVYCLTNVLGIVVELVGNIIDILMDILDIIVHGVAGLIQKAGRALKNCLADAV